MTKVLQWLKAFNRWLDESFVRCIVIVMGALHVLLLVAIMIEAAIRHRMSDVGKAWLAIQFVGGTCYLLLVFLDFIHRLQRKLGQRL